MVLDQKTLRHTEIQRATSQAVAYHLLLNYAIVVTLIMEPDKNQDKLIRQRHSLAHLLAAAVIELWPKAKATIGPAIDDGFYYDFDLPSKISTEDLAEIEAKMRELLPHWDKFSGEKISPAQARKIFADNPYKLEMIDELVTKKEVITIYTSGTGKNKFIDLCRGGHVNSMTEIDPRAFQLDRVAGAYWRGDESNKMLTRIYGLAFASKQELDNYIAQQVEAEKRDHRKLGKELDLFTFDDDVGPGLPLWLPNGTILIEELEKLAKETETRAGYQRVCSPHIAKESLYIKSGHLPYYKESMYPPMEYDGSSYYLRAMNCPHHHKIFATKPKSYRDLPLRLAEYGTCYRHEKSGELFGLMRARILHMNDAHIYCSEEQFFDEFKAVINLYLEYFRIFNINKYVMRLSKHSVEKLGKKYINEPKLWLKTEEMVRQSLQELKVSFVEVEDEAAFYGPKIDVQIWSAIGREFTLATNQVDFAVPARFNLTYTDEQGKEKTPLCIHRAPLSTHERLIGFLIEHYSGAFPLWLAPVQVKILPISDKHLDFSKKVLGELIQNEIRVKLDESNETLGKKVRQAKIEKIPYLVIIGDKETREEKLTIESRDQGKLEELTVKDLIKKLKTEIRNRI